MVIVMIVILPRMFVMMVAVMMMMMVTMFFLGSTTVALNVSFRHLCEQAHVDLRAPEQIKRVHLWRR
eukprot:8964211-Pyramimonas_sp.AAC.1